MTATTTNENPTGSTLVAHAIHELDLIGMTADNPDEMNRMGRRCLLDLVRLFADQGHSGFTAAYTLATLNKLLDFKPLTPITNDPDEWLYHGDVGKNGEGLWQNKRDGECFSADGGKTFRRNSENQSVLHTSAAQS
jgi:hypothetical protein